MRQCAWCGTEFKPRTWHSKMCSGICRKQEARSKYYAPKDALRDATPRACSMCGSQFYGLFGDGLTTCSAPCAKKLKWAQREPEVLKLRKARSHFDAVKPTATKMNAMLKHQHSRCFWCGDELTLAKATIDHLIPLANGGASDYGNYAISCLTCNIRKKDKMPWEFISYLVEQRLGLELVVREKGGKE